MPSQQKSGSANAEKLVAVTGKLPTLSSKNLNRVSVYLIHGNKILSEVPVSAGRSFQVHLAPKVASQESTFAVLGPKGLDSQSLASHTDLPRIALTNAKGIESGAINIDFASLNINDKTIEPWWSWCREYTISGSLQTAANCPIGAQVTVYNVTSGVSGLIRTPLATVPTQPDGTFTASFNWCTSRFCWWPCWPNWWHCWPWWWELDLLEVIENLEHRLPIQTAKSANVQRSHPVPLRQPNTADLMTGVGFAGARGRAELQPDSARTTLIASKFSNPQLREIFPWWWWCCENPNIVFSASQGTTTILDEDPNTSTRWCFASGQTVPLTGNSQSIGACQIDTGGPCGFAWASVGDQPGGVLVQNISMGYADGTPGSPCSNLAFAGSLNLNGVFSGDCLAFYQVLAGQWGGNGNPARGGAVPVTHQPLSVQLTDTITIWSAGVSSQAVVVLGPCSFNGVDNLYMTRSHRQNPPAGVTGLPPFPVIPVGALWGWDAPDLVLTVPSAALAAPAPTGGATLSIVPYDVTGAVLPTGAQPFTMGPDLILTIDNTSLVGAGAITHPTIEWVHVFNSDGSPATQTTASSAECPAYQITTLGGGYALIHTTVIDHAAHLCEYYIQIQYGDGSLPPLVVTPSDRDYAQPAISFTPPSPPAQRYGVDPGYSAPHNLPLPAPLPSPPPFAMADPNNWTYVGGGDTFYVPITRSCCYDFQLWVSKRTTDGQTFTCSNWNAAFQTVNIVVAPVV